MQAIRKILQALFVLSYLVLLPVIILHSLGYTLRSLLQTPIVETGGIFVASAPHGASLSVDERSVNRTTPLSLLSMAPGRHLVSLSLEGFHPWNRTVVVKPGEVTFVDDVLMMPLQREQTRISMRRFDDLISFPGEPWFLASTGPRLGDLFVYDSRTRELAPLAGAAFPFREALVVSILRVEASPVFFIQAQGRGPLRTFQVLFRSPEPLIRDVTALIHGSYNRAAWSAENRRDMFLLRGSAVDWLRIPGSGAPMRLATGVLGFGASDADLYVLDRTRKLLRVPYPRGRPEAVDAFDQALAASAGPAFVRITPLAPDFFVFMGDDGKLSAGLGTRWFESSRVRGFLADSGAGTVLFWQRRRLGLVKFYEEPQQPAAVESAIAPEWIDASGGDIRQAFLAYGNTHVLYVDGDSVLIAGPKSDSGRSIRLVATISPGTSVHYSEADGVLYFLDKKSSQLSSMVIIPRQPPLEELLLGLRSR